MGRKIVKGMNVKVKNNLSLSYSTYGRCSSGGMERMRGHVFPVEYAIGNRVKIYSKHADFTYTFHQDDIVIMEDVKITYPEPQSFDPKYLDI